MTRTVARYFILSAIVAASACHHPPAPVVAPAPVAAPTDDGSAARARADAARRDSIARADADRRAREAADEAARRAREAAEAARAALSAKIYFDYDRDELLPEATAVLDSKVPVLRANAALRIRIEGNADDRGSDEYNLALGQRRAAQARRYLVSRGVAESRIDVTSFGEERPVCHDDAEGCWHQNRRDEFVITSGGEQLATPRN
jgi:peptidoglycan-associated lipoprotein